jgi:ABC-type lipoprotein export system ATPase subunit
MHVLTASAGHRFEVGPWLFRGVTELFIPEAMTAVVGPSGSGKSTLLSALGRTLTLAEGRVDWVGIHRVARVAQSAHGVPARSVRDHLTLPMLIDGQRRDVADELVEPIAASFAIGHLLDVPFRHLSGGEAQRLMLGQAVAARPQLILADEPTASLDAANAQGVISVLEQLAASGAVVVIATHDSRVRSCCDRVIDLATADR